MPIVRPSLHEKLINDEIKFGSKISSYNSPAIFGLYLVQLTRI